MKINLHKLQNENETERQSDKKIKAGQGRTQTTTNWPHAILKGGRASGVGHWQIVFKARLSTHSRYYFNSKQTYFNFNARLWRGDSNKRKKGHKTSEMLNQIKVPATKCKIRQRTRNSNSCRNCRGRKGGGEEVL